MEISLSKHAEKRMKERLNLNKQAATRMANKAYEQGINGNIKNGSLKKYIDSKIKEGKINEYTEVKIYGDYVYIFDDGLLITVFIVPKNLKERANKTQKKVSRKNSTDRNKNYDDWYALGLTP